jgi:integrase
MTTTEREIERLMAVAGKSNRHDHRDSTMILLAFRHGLRASELCSLRCEQVISFTAACALPGPRTPCRAFTR